MKKNYLLVGLLLTFLLITSCTPNPDSTSTSDQTKDQLPIPNQINKIMESQPKPTVIEASQVYSSEVAELIEKSANLNSYHYTFSSSKRNQYESYETVENYEAKIKENKIKKSYSTPVKLSNTLYYSEVYLDTETETALATCDLKTVLCDDNRLQARSLRYPAVKISVNPLEIIENIPKDAKVVGTENIGNRQATIIEYINDEGNKEKLSIDTYSGFPLKQESFIQEDDEDVLLKKNTLNLKSFNNIKNADVTLPEDYELTE